MLPELVSEVRALGVQIADWKTLYDRSIEQHEALIANSSQRIKSLETMLDEALAKVQEAADVDQLLRRQLDEALADAWDGFDPDGLEYPPELDAAFLAWRAVSRERNPSLSVRQQVESWLSQTYPDLSEEARKRISRVCNWEKRGGRRRVPRGK